MNYYGLALFLIIYVLVLIIIYYLVYIFLVAKNKSSLGEFCNENCDCERGLKCVGGNQCAPISDSTSPPGNSCISNSNCKLGYLCINHICSV